MELWETQGHDDFHPPTPRIKIILLPPGLWGSEVFQQINIDAETHGVLQCWTYSQDMKTKAKQSYLPL